MPGKSNNIWAEVGQRREKLPSTGVMRWRKHYQIEALVFNTSPTTHLVTHFRASVIQWPTTHWRESQPSSLGPLTPAPHFLCLVQKSDLNRWCFRMRFLLESNCSCRAYLSRRRKCVWMTLPFRRWVNQGAVPAQHRSSFSRWVSWRVFAPILFPEWEAESKGLTFDSFKCCFLICNENTDIRTLNLAGSTCTDGYGPST